MTPEQKDAQARTRYFVMTLMRISGAVIAMLGIVMLAGRFPAIPPAAGYVLVAIGLLDMAIIPRMLARRWRTPPGA